MPTFSKNRTVTASGPALPVSSSGAPMLELSSMTGSERLSEIYQYELEFLTPSDPALSSKEAANLDLKAMIGKELTVTVQLDGMGAAAPGMSGSANADHGVREISGIVTEAVFAGQSSRQCRYRLTLRPWIHLTDKRSDFRIFQKKSIIEIIDEVLKKYTYSYDKRLSAQYPELPYQVQYGETDYSFIQRLMQEHGIYWFFEHSKKVHRMVLVDQLGAHKPVDSIAYRTLWYYPPGQKIDTEYIDTFDTAESLQSGCWTTNDFNFEKPDAQLGVENSLQRDTAHNQFERYEWPGNYADPKAGERIARLRMEEMLSLGARAGGGGNVRNVVCGTTFRLKGFPYDSANREYLVIEAQFKATEAGDSTGMGEYRIDCSFVVQPTTIVYRPPRTAPKPRTTGPQTAIVTGPQGQEIWTDQYGRVKLKFHWDRSPVIDHNSSCWVRVSYPWAGNDYGSISIPRVGSEVIVDFENGDPDRPIVTGRVYNALNMPPWPLPDNATQSGTLTRSTQGGYETANAIRFEDKKDSEELWIHAEKDMRVEVENDESLSVQRDRTVMVDGMQVTQVGKNCTIVAGERLELKSGDAIFIMEKSGAITLRGKQLLIEGTGAVQINGKDVDIN
ncbi:type IV secretion protein Rhs [Burkholderia ubonensis]|uniref:Type IV secretion protein Rhs n=1 Tax=Burkholderia ubonensis TaxID=101571 RepID=A0A1R1JJ15_9BURK|nr:type IV secretion protein Rhs [Burkholderia ubonensis]